jgi:hypothetical protein
MRHYAWFFERPLLTAAPFIAISASVPNTLLFGGSIRKREFFLATLCLPNLIYGLIEGGSFIAYKTFRFQGFGLRFHYDWAIAAAAMVFVIVIRTIWLLVASRRLIQPLFSCALLLAAALFMYAHATKTLNGTLHSASAFAVAGIIGIVGAVRARIRTRPADYDLAIANSGLALTFSALLSTLAVWGM